MIESKPLTSAEKGVFQRGWSRNGHQSATKNEKVLSLQYPVFSKWGWWEDEMGYYAIEFYLVHFIFMVDEEVHDLIIVS